ncbi:aromatic acid exporter family protein [Streptomyces sp. NRRL S-378]|uniref:aromatic acid exporter family protein n=1 Tax=Streptomyces sp. NRRL S-378 TaxID=1463904 RepID=UPI00099BC273|nr:aromatic acid exporter family protein [Streptomyces sp. NRRL S-378]
MTDWRTTRDRMRETAAGRAAYLRRAVRAPGNERDELLLGAKAVVAAMVAWVLARYLLPPTVSTFAPFTALVALQATVYRSLRDCIQYLLAMAAGAALAASLAAVAGIHGWTFGLLTLLALCLGRSERFGEQGLQVAVVAFFAFSSGQGRIGYIGHLAASVTLGALCGLAAHLVLAPARHVHHRQQAVADLYSAMSRRLETLAALLDGEDPDTERLRHWRRDGQTLAAACDRIRNTIHAEMENSRLHPRRSRRVSDTADTALSRARDAVTVAERAMDHLRSLTRTLDYAQDSGEINHLPMSFRTASSSLLRRSAHALQEIGRTSLTDSARLNGLIEEATTDLDRVEQHERATAEASPSVHTLQGTLLTDIGRLLAELRTGHDALTTEAAPGAGGTRHRIPRR